MLAADSPPVATLVQQGFERGESWRRSIRVTSTFVRPRSVATSRAAESTADNHHMVRHENCLAFKTIETSILGTYRAMPYTMSSDFLSHL